MASFTKIHFEKIANCISKSLQVVGRDVNTPYAEITREQRAQAFDVLMSRMIDMFVLDNDLFNKRRFKEAAGLT